MDFLTGLLDKARSALGSFFAPKQPEQMVSPIPARFSELTRPAGFIGPLQSPAQPVTTPSPQPQPDTGNLGDFGSSGGGGERGQTTSFGMPGELLGTLRDVNGITWQHQGNDQWIALRQTGQDQSSNAIDSLMSAIVDPVSKAMQEWYDRLNEFDKNNPFAFDEAQAKASAEERLNPYYNATLNEFMTGIRASRSRSLEDETRTVGELNADASKLSERERIATQEAIRGSEEGFAGAGLFFSGRRERATGMEEVGGLQSQEDIGTTLGRGVESAKRLSSRTLEDLALREAREKRLSEAERTTALETDISGRKKEAAYQRGLEKLAYAGQAPGLDIGNRLRLESDFLSRF